MKTIYNIDDRDIVFSKGCLYAVVLSSYYGGNEYTTHKTPEAAIARSKQLDRGDWEHSIIDTKGNHYSVVRKNWADSLEIL